MISNCHFHKDGHLACWFCTFEHPDPKHCNVSPEDGLKHDCIINIANGTSGVECICGDHEGML